MLNAVEPLALSAALGPPRDVWADNEAAQFVLPRSDGPALIINAMKDDTGCRFEVEIDVDDRG